MALYHLTQENFQGAVEQYRKVADLNSDKAEALFKIGHQYLDLAARLAYRGARLYPESAVGASIPWRYAVGTRPLGRCCA